MEAEEAGHMRFRGDSQVRTLAPGHTFTLEDHPFDEFNIEYMVLSVWHHGRNNLGNDGAAEYREFTLHPHAVTWRAPLSTPKGWCAGRRLHWSPAPPARSCTSTSMAGSRSSSTGTAKASTTTTALAGCAPRPGRGNGYGTMFIRAVGMEVVVDFLEGDPDQPLVTGCVYNRINKPPYDLLRMPPVRPSRRCRPRAAAAPTSCASRDKKGSEEVFLQAQKHLVVNVKANHQPSAAARTSRCWATAGRWWRGSVEAAGRPRRHDGSGTGTLGGQASLRMIARTTGDAGSSASCLARIVGYDGYLHGRRLDLVIKPKP